MCAFTVPSLHLQATSCCLRAWALKIIQKKRKKNVPLPFFANCAGAVKAFNDTFGIPMLYQRLSHRPCSLGTQARISLSVLACATTGRARAAPTGRRRPGPGGRRHRLTQRHRHTETRDTAPAQRAPARQKEKPQNKPNTVEIRALYCNFLFFEFQFATFDILRIADRPPRAMERSAEHQFIKLQIRPDLLAPAGAYSPSLIALRARRAFLRQITAHATEISAQ